MTNRPDPVVVPTLSERLRADRRRDLLEVARDVVAEVGVAALTMQRVADRMGCSIGSVYRYYPSKVALLAALQLDAGDRLARTLTLALAYLDDLLDERRVDNSATKGLARVVAAARFWTVADLAYPDDVGLSRQMLCRPSGWVGDQDESPPPADMKLLVLVGELLDDAAKRGALVQGDNHDRAVIMVAGTAGVLMASPAQREGWDAFDARRIAVDLTRDLLQIWGAEAELLRRSERLVDDLATRGQLIPSPGSVK